MQPAERRDRAGSRLLASGTGLKATRYRSISADFSPTGTVFLLFACAPEPVFGPAGGAGWLAGVAATRSEPPPAYITITPEKGNRQAGYYWRLTCAISR